MPEITSIGQKIMRLIGLAWVKAKVFQGQRDQPGLFVSLESRHQSAMSSA